VFFTIEDLIALSKEIRRLPKPEIDEELRGWSYSEGVVSSQTKLLMGVSDITNNFCPNGRDIYLRYVKKVPRILFNFCKNTYGNEAEFRRKELLMRSLLLQIF